MGLFSENVRYTVIKGLLITLNASRPIDPLSDLPLRPWSQFLFPSGIMRGKSYFGSVRYIYF